MERGKRESAKELPGGRRTGAKAGPARQIVSVSRRTDVPAFHGGWFLDRLSQGSADFRNPFSGATHTVSLRREDVRCFVFWSKNFAPFLDALERVHREGYPFLLQYTINGYPGELEPRVPGARESVETFRLLSEKYGPERLTWRYDPLIFTSLTGAEFHEVNFTRLAALLQGATGRCVTSFTSFYKKVRAGLEGLRRATGITCSDPPPGEKAFFARRLSEIAAARGMSLSACCTPEILSALEASHCVDAALIDRLFGEEGTRARRNPTRKGCGCSDSRDIGAYGTCGHGCVYCYANSAATFQAKGEGS